MSSCINSTEHMNEQLAKQWSLEHDSTPTCDIIYIKLETIKRYYR